MSPLVTTAQGYDMITASDLGFKPTASPRGTLIVPSTPEFTRVGGGSMHHDHDGDLALFFDARHSGGDHDKSVIRRIDSQNSGQSWQMAATVLSHPVDSILQPSVVRLSGGRLGMSYSRLLGNKRARKLFVTSSDDGHTWSEPTPISQKECGYMTGAHDRLLLLPEERLIALVHGKKAVGPGEYDAYMVTYVYTSDDAGTTWKNCTPQGLDAPGNPSKKNQYGLWEASVVSLREPDRLLLYGRTATGWLFESHSDDSGDSWTVPTQTPIPNPLAPVRLTRVPDTSILLMFRNPLVDMESGWHGGARRVLAVQSSMDEGRTWGPWGLLEFVEAEKQWFDYPFILWIGTTLHVGYRAPIPDTPVCSIYHRMFTRDEIMQLAEHSSRGDVLKAAPQE